MKILLNKKTELWHIAFKISTLKKTWLYKCIKLTKIIDASTKKAEKCWYEV